MVTVSSYNTVVSVQCTLFEMNYTHSYNQNHSPNAICIFLFKKTKKQKKKKEYMASNCDTCVSYPNAAWCAYSGVCSYDESATCEKDMLASALTDGFPFIFETKNLPCPNRCNVHGTYLLFFYFLFFVFTLYKYTNVYDTVCV